MFCVLVGMWSHSPFFIFLPFFFTASDRAALTEEAEFSIISGSKFFMFQFGLLWL